MRRVLVGGAGTAAVLLAFVLAPRADRVVATESPSVWTGRPGAIAATFVSGTGYAVVGAVSFDREAGKTRSRVALVDARSAREIWSEEYRNRQCCLLPSIGFLSGSREVVASGDELLRVSLDGKPSRPVELGGSTIDMAAAGGRVLVGTLEGGVLAFQAGKEVWREAIPHLMAVALSTDGLAAAASPRAVAVFDGRTGRPITRISLGNGRAVALTFGPGALLVIAHKTADGVLEVLGIDARTWQRRWAVSLGPTTMPAVDTAGRVIVVSDFLGRVGAVLSSSGVVQKRWTETENRVFVAGSAEGEIAVALGSSIEVFAPTGKVRWRGTIPGTVLGLRLGRSWLAAVGNVGQNAYTPDRVWFARTDQRLPPR